MPCRTTTIVIVVVVVVVVVVVISADYMYIVFERRCFASTMQAPAMMHRYSVCQLLRRIQESSCAIAMQ